MQTFDIIIIGSGGGTKLAMPAAQSGLRVALIENDAFGGTCLNRGCIPSKMLIYPAEVADLARHAARLGIRGLNDPRPDFAAIVRRISASVDKTSAENRAAHAQHPGITFLQGQAQFTGDHTIAINGTELRAEKIFIAAGSRPRIPDIPGLAGTPFMTSTEALRNTTPPRRLLILGGGYIAAELGYAYSALGTDVHLILRSHMLRHEDQEIADEFTRVFARRHTLHSGAAVARVDYRHGEFTVELQGADGSGMSLTAEALLVATGVVPNTDNIGLAHTAITLSPDGFINVDDHLRTTVPGVYALGDCIGRHLFRHTVNYEGEYLMRTAVLGRDDRPLDYGPVPHAVFAHPQIAGVGPTETELRAQGIDLLVGRARYADCTAGEARMLDHGLVKILIDRQTDRVLGAHIVGDEASNMLHLFIVLMKKSGTLADLLDMIFIHPALPEVARNAARDARRQRP
ncbi:MAG: dihydrolipoyl dehydrogenase [Verrucomicrobia bacterium]|nr:dihydrolipoyl dehydrogenase [Verrucomicrobiota bacterium]